jgi:hypothetical protein
MHPSTHLLIVVCTLLNAQRGYNIQFRAWPEPYPLKTQAPSHLVVAICTPTNRQPAIQLRTSVLSCSVGTVYEHTGLNTPCGRGLHSSPRPHNHIIQFKAWPEP